jgi:hypothetical protein
MNVREGAAALHEPSFVVFAGANLGKGRLVEDEGGGVELIKDGKIALIQDLLKETTN